MAVLITKGAAFFGCLFVLCLLTVVGLVVYILVDKQMCESPLQGSTTRVPTAASVQTSSTIASGPEPWYQVRLPRNIRPTHYQLLVQPDLDSGLYSGSVNIEVIVSEPTTYVLINVHPTLNISSARIEQVTANGMSEVEVDKEFQYDPGQFYVLQTKELLTANATYNYKLKFNGDLTRRLVGFYRSSYKKQNGENSWVVSSKFEPTYAREAFPCFDEPNIKAEYTVTLVYPRKYTALSNMPPMQEQEISGGLRKTTFQRSVPMSVYLVCIVIGECQFKLARTDNNVPFSVYAVPEQIDQADYALSLGVHATNFYEKYFDLPYTYPTQPPKQDMIAIPDFSSGAMEHWGLITYREVNMLYDKEGSSERNKQRVAAVICHELSHMWFGNIVTMDWWDDLWLNEGFASFMKYKGMVNYESGWDMQDINIVEQTQPVLKLDGAVSSHPIRVPVNSPDEITEIFDTISYSKGSAIIRMLESYMGEEAFKVGIQRYLKKYKHKSARTDNLWEILGASAAVPVARMMDTWTRQMGYPVVTITRDIMLPSRAKATQSRFFNDRSTEQQVLERSHHHLDTNGIFH